MDKRVHALDAIGSQDLWPISWSMGPSVASIGRSTTAAKARLSKRSSTAAHRATSRVSSLKSDSRALMISTRRCDSANRSALTIGARTTAHPGKPSQRSTTWARARHRSRAPPYVQLLRCRRLAAEQYAPSGQLVIQRRCRPRAPLLPGTRGPTGRAVHPHHNHRGTPRTARMGPLRRSGHPHPRACDGAEPRDRRSALGRHDADPGRLDPSHQLDRNPRRSHQSLPRHHRAANTRRHDFAAGCQDSVTTDEWERPRIEE